MKLLRRIRGVLGTAFTWGAAFAVVSTGLAAIAMLSMVASGEPTPTDLPGGIAAVLLGGVARWAAVGALSGAVFAATIMVAERRQTLATLSSRRFARWGLLAGALGSTAVAVAFVALLSPAGFLAASGWSLAAMMSGVPVVGGALGHVAATTTLKAARRGGAPPPLPQALNEVS